jgi:diacylglycerol kinase (ATP)
VRGILIVNREARRGVTASSARAVIASLREVCQLRTAVTASAAEAEAAIAAAVADGVDVVVVAGGDGAVRLALQACAHSETALAVVPTGTGNDFARAFGIPQDPVAAADLAARAIASGSRQQVDLGKVAGGGWFSTVLCAGFDAQVNARANRLRWLSGHWRYDVALLIELSRLHAMPLRVETPETIVELDATLVAVGNTSWYGGGIPICPDANPADGLLDITVVGEVTLRDFAAILPHLRTGRHVEHPAVYTLQTDRVRLSGENGWLAFADGDPAVRLPLTVHNHPGALTVVR